MKKSLKLAITLILFVFLFYIASRLLVFFYGETAVTGRQVALLLIAFRLIDRIAQRLLDFSGIMGFVTSRITLWTGFDPQKGKD